MIIHKCGSISGTCFLLHVNEGFAAPIHADAGIRRTRSDPPHGSFNFHVPRFNLTIRYPFGGLLRRYAAREGRAESPSGHKNIRGVRVAILR